MIDLRMDLPACFSDDYAKARGRFLGLCARYGVAVRSLPNPQVGPEGGALAADTAWFGPSDAMNVMVLISATHGVEGFCGSAAQLDWLLHGGPARLPDDTAALVVHAINPYGFAWWRRTTEEGVDLNRNGVDFGAPLPVNADYATLADAIVPRSFDAAPLAAADAQLARFRSSHGDSRYTDALCGGQYTHPAGLFYGGTAPTWSRRTTEKIIADHDLARRRMVAVVDYHTGLGPHGHGEPICGHKPGESGQARCRAWYGDSLGEPLLGTSASRPIQGMMQNTWNRLVGAERFTFIALEFGTYAAEAGQRALREEHWLHAQGAVDWTAPSTRRIKQALLNFFYPATRDWQEMVLFRSRQIINQTLGGIVGRPAR
ncbi:MAG: DUF2817 domain-containing protein [Alphaproteobacteria bacterium]|nr:DUF2817 domain-containing protein [Alphaproteobacteria bacterium]